MGALFTRRLYSGVMASDAPRSMDGSALSLRSASRTLGLGVTALLFVSSLLQGVAAVQRWLFFDHATIGRDRTIEDHLFDYAFPADPWVSVGSAAILFGIGYVLVAAAVACIGGAAAATHRITVVVWTVTFVAAGPLVLTGVHALVSGILGSPSPLQYVVGTSGALLLGLLQAVGLTLLAVFVARRSLAWAVGVVVLIGTTVFGHFLAVFTIGPWIVGYQSYDTTPWSEAVVAGFTAIAAIAVLTGSFRLPNARVAPSPQGSRTRSRQEV